MKAFSLFAPFLLTPKPHLILPPLALAFSVELIFCQVIISHSLVEHAVINEACTSLLLFIQTRLNHLIFKSKNTGFFFFFIKPPVYGLLRAVMFIAVQTMLS